MNNDSLDETRLRDLLGEGVVLGRRVEVHASVDSTNDVAASHGARGEPEGLVVVAESQEAGRGRRGSRWFSQPGMDLLFSILLRPRGGPETWPWLVHGAAVGICRVVEAVSGVPAGIKWPNDVYMPGNRKVCGILMETVMGGGGEGRGYAVLGIGLNVNSSGFPAEIGDAGVSLKEICGGENIDRERVLVSLLHELEAIYAESRVGQASVLEEAERRSVLQGRQIAIGEGEKRIRGAFLGLGEGGSLLLRDEGGAERVFHSAEHLELIE